MRSFGIILFSALVPIVSADGGYANYCNNITLVDVDGQAGLRAYCPEISGTTQCSIISLDLCYGADNGKVKPQDKGNLSQRCPPKRSELDGTTLTSRCHRRTSNVGRLAWTSVDTNALIIADDGVLKCFDNRASTPPDCNERPLLSGTQRRYVPVPLIACLYMLMITLFMW